MVHDKVPMCHGWLKAVEQSHSGEIVCTFFPEADVQIALVARLPQEISGKVMPFKSSVCRHRTEAILTQHDS